MRALEFISNSDKETRQFAQKFAKCLKQNDCLALSGTFGSGKTTFVKGLMKGLGLKKGQGVVSPSFVILKIYSARLPVYHFDLYRLDELVDIEAVGLYEFISCGGITVIEWADKIKGSVLKDSIKISFKVSGPSKRRLSFAVKDESVKKFLKTAIKKLNS